MSDRRENRVFRSERRDIEFPMWRKKVDASIFEDQAILVPKFCERWWRIASRFKGIRSRRNAKSLVKIAFRGRTFTGFVTELGAKKRTGSYRLFYDGDLAAELKAVFMMSLMRDLEFKLGAQAYAQPDNRVAIEDVIPFQEFLDIEYDAKLETFRFVAHFTQRPTFPHLFASITESTILTSIERTISGKSAGVLKSRWFKRDQLSSRPDATNVIYYLLDVPNKRLYVGEAKSLRKRLAAHRHDIPDWTHFRYDRLPDELAPSRVAIERIVISAFVNLLPSAAPMAKPMIESDFRIANKKADLV